MPLIYRKTAKGLTEIETRAHRLPPRLRSALILVDGRRDVNDLKPLITQQAEETLSSLAEQGFIEAVSASARSASPAPASAPALAAATSSKSGNDFDSTRRAAVRELNDQLGPAAENLSIKMEKASNLGELIPLLVQGAQSIAAVRGRSAAEAFAKRFGVG
jgi:hypothetical protein